MSITFPDGYVTPIAGPIVLETTDGYVIKDPGSKRSSGAIILPLAGVGLGALIGHSVGTSQGTLTSSIPAGCNPAQFGCLTSSMPIPGSKGKDTAIGAAIGGAAGMIASITLLVGGHHFYLDAGAPVQMTLLGVGDSAAGRSGENRAPVAGARSRRTASCATASASAASAKC